MKRCIAILLLLLPVLSMAQQSAELPSAGNIRRGVLPNGISYYIVSNGFSRGYADFALIQQGMSGNPETREALASLPGFSKTRPYRYLAGNGVGYRPEGYISSPEEAAVFRFEDVPVFNGNVADSTLLMIFEIMKVSPLEQALVISGDVDSNQILQRIQMLSLSVPERSGLSEVPVYQWMPSDSARVTVKTNGSENLAAINISYHSQRQPRGAMNTPLPVLSRIYAARLGEILSNRIRKVFYEAGIPLAGISSDYLDSSMTGGDEEFRMSIYTSDSRCADALRLFAGILSDVDRRGVTLYELQSASRIVRGSMEKMSGRDFLSNRENVDKCISSYLYGANLASGAAINDYFSRRTLPVEMELDLFRRFCSALLSSTSNLSLDLSVSHGSLDEARAWELFSEGWMAFPETSVQESQASTYRMPAAKKVRLKSSLKDPVTGGEIWTFSNGMKVVYRKTEGSTGQFRYALTLRGGVPEIPGLERGESACVGDVIGIYDIAGMSGDDFRHSLSSEGISMDAAVTLTDLRIFGDAPSASVQDVLQAIMALGYARSMPEEKYAYYRECAALMQERESSGSSGISSAMEEMVCPDYLYPEYRVPGNLSDNLPAEVEEYMSSLFSKCDDGALILIGDLDASSLKNVLSRYLGAFVTGKKHTARSKVSYPIRKGWFTYNSDSNGNGEDGQSVNVLVRSSLPFSLKSMMSLELACDALETALEVSLADKGFSVEVQGKALLFPSEMISVEIECRPCEQTGLPSGISPGKLLPVLASVRSVITGLALTPVDGAMLEGGKQALLHRIDSRMGDPQWLMDAALVRNAGGYDVVSGCQDYIKAIGVPDIEAVFKALDSGVKVEYIVK